MERKLIPRPFLLSLCAAGLLATRLAASTPPTAMGDCDDAYFGIHRASDFSRALRCYQSEKRWDLLIVMYLNGEGTPVDIGKAETLLQEWERELEDQVSGGVLEARALRMAIEERKQHPGIPYPRVDYCRDIAQDTLTLNFCGYVNGQIEEVQQEARMMEIRGELTPAQRSLFDQVVKAFSRFEEAESGRVYQLYAGGTGRNLAAMGQAAVVRAHLSATIEETVARRGLQPVDQAAYEAADRELNQVYQDDIHKVVEGQEEVIRSSSQKELIDMYRAQIAAYEKAAREAQLRWIRYRDLYADLARSLYPNQPTFDSALSLKTALTRSRVSELRHDPMGPDTEEREEP